MLAALVAPALVAGESGESESGGSLCVCSSRATCALRLPKDLEERLPTDKRVWRKAFALALLVAFLEGVFCVAAEGVSIGNESGGRLLR